MITRRVRLNFLASKIGGTNTLICSLHLKWQCYLWFWTMQTSHQPLFQFRAFGQSSWVEWRVTYIILRTHQQENHQLWSYTASFALHLDSEERENITIFETHTNHWSFGTLCEGRRRVGTWHHHLEEQGHVGLLEWRFCECCKVPRKWS